MPASWWVLNSHVLSDGGIADSVGGSGQASFATVAGATAVETGHVNAVQVIVHAAPRGARLVLSVFLIRPSIGQGKGRAREGMMDRRGEGRGGGGGDPRETTECKQVVEEEVRRGEGALCGVH